MQCGSLRIFPCRMANDRPENPRDRCEISFEPVRDENACQTTQRQRFAFVIFAIRVKLETFNESPILTIGQLLDDKGIGKTTHDNSGADVCQRGKMGGLGRSFVHRKA